MAQRPWVCASQTMECSGQPCLGSGHKKQLGVRAAAITSPARYEREYGDPQIPEWGTWEPPQDTERKQVPGNEGAHEGHSRGHFLTQVAPKLYFPSGLTFIS